MALSVDLDGRRAVVTGAGKGIGREICLALARAGADVFGVSRTPSDLDSLGREVRSRGLAPIDLTVHRGSLTVISGPVGTGKTSLLRGVLGLVPTDGGEVRWNGEPVVDLVLRYEKMEEDLPRVEQALGGLPILSRLSRANSHQRKDRRPASEVLAPAQKIRIQETCREEFALYGYEP